jgi:hypothetical protein
VQKTVTVMTYQPEQKTVTVNTCRTEQFTENVPVTVCRMEMQQRTDNVTVYHQKVTPVPATRTVNVCVPYEDTVTVTRCVPQYVQKTVQVGCGGCGGCGH